MCRLCAVNTHKTKSDESTVRGFSELSPPELTRYVRGRCKGIIEDISLLHNIMFH